MNGPSLSGLSLDGVPTPLKAALEQVTRQISPWLRGASDAFAGGLAFPAPLNAQLVTLTLDVPSDWVRLGEAWPLGAGWSVPDDSQWPRLRRVGDEVVGEGLLFSPASGTVDSTQPLFHLPEDKRWRPEAAATAALVYHENSTAKYQATLSINREGTRAVYVYRNGTTSANLALAGLRYAAWDRSLPPASIFPVTINPTIRGFSGALVLGAVPLDEVSGRVPDYALTPGQLRADVLDTRTQAGRVLKVTNITGLHPGRRWRVALLLCGA